jgi:dienelactone hydrolase
MTSDIVRREFDTRLELVTKPVAADAYRYVPQGTYARVDGVEYRYDACLPANPDRPPPVVVFVHGDGPPDFLREPRLWGQYRSWAALAAANGLAAITFDHASSEGRSRMPAVVDQIRQLLDLVDHEYGSIGIDAGRVAIWSASAGVPFGFVAALDRPTVLCQVSFYGPMDLRTDASRAGPDIANELLAEYSPVTHLERRGAGMPPLLIVKAALDRPAINDSIDAFVERATAIGAPVELEVHEQGRHAFDVIDEGERSEQIIHRTIDSMRAHLGR